MGDFGISQDLMLKHINQYWIGAEYHMKKFLFINMDYIQPHYG